MIELSLILVLNLVGLLVSIPNGGVLSGPPPGVDGGLARLALAVRGASRATLLKLLRHGGLLTLGTTVLLWLLGVSFTNKTTAWLLLAPLLGGAAALGVASLARQFSHHAVERMASLSSAPPQSVASAIALRAGGAAVGVSEATSSVLVVGVLLLNGNQTSSETHSLIAALAAMTLGASIAGMLVHSVGSAQQLAALYGQSSAYFPLTSAQPVDASANPSRVLELAASANRSLVDGARGLSVSLLAHCSVLIVALHWLKLSPSSPLLLLLPLVRAFGAASALTALFIVRPEDGEPAVRGLWRTWWTSALLALSSAVGACYWLAGRDASVLAIVCVTACGTVPALGHLQGFFQRRSTRTRMASMSVALRSMWRSAGSGGFGAILLAVLALSMGTAAWLGAGVNGTNGPLFGLLLSCATAHACSPVSFAYQVHNHTLHAAGAQIDSPLANPRHPNGRRGSALTVAPTADLQAATVGLTAFPQVTTMAIVVVALGLQVSNSHRLAVPCLAGLAGVLFVLLHDGIMARHVNSAVYGLHNWYEDRFSTLARNEDGSASLPPNYRPAYAACVGAVEKLSLGAASMKLVSVPFLAAAGYWAVSVFASQENSISVPSVATWFLAFASSVGISQSLLSAQAAMPLTGVGMRANSGRTPAASTTGAEAITDAYNHARGSALQLLIETLGALLLLLSVLSQSTS